MNQFNAKLEQARRRQKYSYLVAGLLTFTLMVLLGVLFVISRGTPVDVQPAEAKDQATIRAVGGLAFSFNNTVYSITDKARIAVSSPGYKEKMVTIDSVYLGKVFPLELIALPGHLVIETAGNISHLSQTVWRIKSREIGLGAALDTELEAGIYTVTIDNPFYEIAEVEAVVKRGKKTNIKLELKAVQGSVSLSSTPPGAEVFIAEKSVGLSPLKLDMGGGVYDLRLESENYQDIIEEVEITRIHPQVSRNYHLRLKQGKIIFDLHPEGGTLLVNGRAAEEPLLLDATIEHKLHYSKPGYYPEDMTVVLEAGEERVLVFQLREELGKITLSSRPAASVFIDNKEYGLSPVTATLPAVSHTISYRKKGYRTVTKNIRPQGGKVLKDFVNLLTEYQARLQEAAKEFTNSAGIQLKLFTLQDEFTMGAPRSEKGQRANEFLKKVRLTRPFYVSIYEITNRQFAQFKPKAVQNKNTNPVTDIGWQESMAYCNWLSERENLQPFYLLSNGRITGFKSDSDGYRLLSEAEWEWLARKAGKDQQTVFSWGNNMIIPPRFANIADESAKGIVRFYVPRYTDGFSTVAPVGSFDKEPSGLYDIAGNVSEWVHDGYSLVPPLTQQFFTDPLGPVLGDTHLIKGANFRSGTLTTLRPAYREGLTHGRDDVGFRIGRYLYGGENE